ncbi:MAG: hypothetical protein R3C56_13540 [Pirellulaceae bacterium]
MTAESNGVGQGAAFVLTLPLMRQRECEFHMLEASRAPARILLVDDEQAIHAAYRTILVNKQVDTAARRPGSGPVWRRPTPEQFGYLSQRLAIRIASRDAR